MGDPGAAENASRFAILRLVASRVAAKSVSADGPAVQHQGFRNSLPLLVYDKDPMYGPTNHEHRPLVVLGVPAPLQKKFETRSKPFSVSPVRDSGGVF